MLILDEVHTYYGNIHALRGISLDVNQGEIVTLIGANGAGKTTTLKTISGLLHPRQGTVVFEGKDISRVAGPQARPERDRAGAGGPPDLLPPHRDGEPPDGGLHAEVGGDQGGHRARLRALPAPEGAVEPEGRDALGRRAADARDRPGDDGAAAGPPSRRALARPRADPRPADLRDHQGDQRPGDHDPPRGAERPPGALDREPRLRPPDGPRRPLGPGPGAHRRTRWSARRISARTDPGTDPGHTGAQARPSRPRPGGVRAIPVGPATGRTSSVSAAGAARPSPSCSSSSSSGPSSSRS